MNYLKELRIAELITAQILGTIDDEGQRMLDRWEKENEDNRILLRKLTKENLTRYFAVNDDETDIENVIAEIHTRIASSQRIIRKPVRRPLLWITAITGIFALVLALSVLTGKKDTEPSTDTLSNIIPDPASKVKIILPSGEEVKLDEMTGSIDAGNGVINREESGLVFTPGSSTFDNHMEPVMTTIVTEQGGELNFRLGDGTSVWLNTDSEFSFPMEFGPDKRLVKLKGEAYFEVRHDPSKPFIVSTEDMDIRVLGTVFNVKSYPDDPYACATLLSGRVEVDTRGQKKELKPGFAATIDRETGKLTVAETDTFAATAWLHGQLVFVDESVDAVLRTLSRWYDVKFVFEGLSTSEYTFNGRMTKYDPLRESLNRITLAGGPSFLIDGDTIYVR